MVGKRSLPTPLVGKPKSGANNRKKSTSSYGGRGGGGGGGNGDLESGTGYETYHDEVNGNGNGNNNARPRPKILDGKAPKPGIWRFRDAARTALEDERREDLKNKLLTHINHDELERFRKSDEELKEMKKKEVRKFYEAQNERLNDWLEVDAIVMAVADDVLESMDPDPDNDGTRERGGGIQDVQGNIYELLPDDEKKKRAQAEKRAKWAINVNVIANILLLAGKIFAASTTGSLSLIASLLDSALDLLCTVIVWTTNKIVGWRLDRLQKRFPVGRKRLEPLGILVFSIIMVISFAQILQESVEKLMPLEGEAEALGNAAIAALVATVVVKGIIWFGCSPIKTTQVQALAKDCKTDVNFNTLSLLFPLIGYYADIWWLDPAGAAILSIFIIFDWASTCFENITRLSGQAADTEFIKKLMYIAYRFSPVVQGFKSVTAYHAGDGVWVEIDVLMEPDTKLHHAHDVAETLQYCCEGLQEVDRCFVTIDYSSSGPTGHANDAERV